MTNLIRKATKNDVFNISLNLREADKNEIYASSNTMLYYGTLLESFEDSSECYVWVNDDKPVMVFGVVDTENGGVAWAMGTDEFKKDIKFFFETSKEMINEFLNRYNKLFNYVYVENTMHINWLKRVGFVFDDEPITLKNGSKFIRFEMEK